MRACVYIWYRLHATLRCAQCAVLYVRMHAKKETHLWCPVPSRPATKTSRRPLSKFEKIVFSMKSFFPSGLVTFTVASTCIYVGGSTHTYTHTFSSIYAWSCIHTVPHVYLPTSMYTDIVHGHIDDDNFFTGINNYYVRRMTEQLESGINRSRAPF